MKNFDTLHVHMYYESFVRGDSFGENRYEKKSNGKLRKVGEKRCFLMGGFISICERKVKKF